MSYYSFNDVFGDQPALPKVRTPQEIADEQNAQQGQQRNALLSAFMKQYASPGNQNAVDQFQGDAGWAKNTLAGFLPQMQQNRFDSALTDSQNRLTQLMDNPDSINQSAAYKFRLGQGMEALQRALGKSGLLNSGNRLHEITDYAQGQASQEYGNQLQARQNLYGTNAQAYNADKNATTQQGNMLADIYGKAGNLYNSAVGNTNADTANMINAWTKTQPQPSQYFAPPKAGGAAIRWG